MHRFILALLFFVSFAFAGEPVWRDEFDGNHLDSSKWSLTFPGQRADAINTLKSVSVSDGMLHIHIRKTKHGIESVMIASNLERSQGYWEVRAKCSDTFATWSDAWLYNPAAAIEPFSAMEVDIFEHRRYDETRKVISSLLAHGIHWNGYGEHSRFVGGGSNIEPNQFFVAGFNWIGDTCEWYINGNKVFSAPAYKDHPLYFILSTEIDGKSWAGPLAHDYDQETLTVDYVRYYEVMPCK